MTTYTVNTYRVTLTVNDEPEQGTNSPGDSVRILREIFRHLDADQEHSVLLALNIENQVIGYKVLASGGMSVTPVDPKLLWWAAFTLGAESIIIVHNHTCQNPHPSRADIAFTKRCQDDAAMLGFRFLDHILLGYNTHYSFKDNRRNDMKAIRVTFADGRTIDTNINGTMEEIRAYYVGKSFNFGDTEEHPRDRLVEAIAVEELRGGEK